jgi:hypothetical protein
MPASLLAEDALAARVHPDAAEAPSGRIEAGTELAELERIGDWVRVETPAGDRWWVDGRRLIALPPPPAAAEAPPVPMELQPSPPPPPPSRPQETEPAGVPAETELRRRFPPLLVGVVVAAVLLAGLGVVLLSMGSDPRTPRVLQGWFALDVAPDVVTSGSDDKGVFLLSDGAVAVGTNVGVSDRFTLATAEVSDLVGVTAAVGHRRGVAALTGEPAVVTVFPSDAAAEGSAIEAVERLPLPDGDYAPAMASDGLRVLVFPESGGRSSSFLSIDLESGTTEEHLLGETVEVVSAVEHFEYLYVGHTAGVLVHYWDGSCGQPVTRIEVNTPALAAVEKVWEGRMHSVVALDRERDVLAVIDWEGERAELDTCGGSYPVPYVIGTIDLGVDHPLNTIDRVRVGADAGVATTIDAAYVATSNGDLVIVDLNDPADPSSSSIRVIPGLSPGSTGGIALYSDFGSSLHHAFVADEERLWWIAPDGPESRDQLELADVEVRR